MGSETKIYYMRDADLVMNTMIDALKYEKRRVIDINDIIFYKKELKSKMKEKNLSIVYYGTYRNQDEFDKEIKDYAIRYKDKFVLLPWIDQNELILNFRGTLPFPIYKIISKKDRDSFVLERDFIELDEFQKIDDIVLENSITSILNVYRKVKK